MTMSAQTPDVGEASETLPVNYEGEALEIGFNPQFLQDGLESVEADELVAEADQPVAAGPDRGRRGGRWRGRGQVPLPDHAGPAERLAAPAMPSVVTDRRARRNRHEPSIVRSKS